MFRRLALCAALSLAASVAPTELGEPLRAQTLAYRSARLGDVMAGVFPPGERVETSGDLRWSGAALLLNVAYMSAVVPLAVDAGRLRAGQLAAIQKRCFAPTLQAACRATVRGEVAKRDKRASLIAHEIDVQDHPDRRLYAPGSR
jgi:hypothetical protein